MVLPARRLISVSLCVSGVAALAFAQSATVPQLPPARPRAQIQVDEERARSLYVSRDPKDHAPGYDFQRDVAQKAEIDKRYAEASRGVMDFKKISYRSSVGDMDIPAYLFQPLTTRGTRGHAAMVWVHGGVHGNWGIGMFPFVKEAVERGYIIICPEYRGSTGHGEKHHNRLRRVRGRRCDERRGLSQDVATR
jgi:acetyl esterase/lipase